jgi:hypothetical protein
VFKSSPLPTLRVTFRNKLFFSYREEELASRPTSQNSESEAAEEATGYHQIISGQDI